MGRGVEAERGELETDVCVVTTLWITRSRYMRHTSIISLDSGMDVRTSFVWWHIRVSVLMYVQQERFIPTRTCACVPFSPPQLPLEPALSVDDGGEAAVKT